MNAVLKIVLSLSVSGSLLILILFLCKLTLRERFSRRWQYYIWLVVIARLLLPFTPETSLIGNLFQAIDRDIVQMDMGTISVQKMPSAPQNENNLIIDKDSYVQDTGLSTTAIPLAKKISATLLQNMWVVWLAVALMLLVRKITVYQSFVQYIKAGRIEVSDVVLLDRLALIEEQMGVKRAVELYINNLISSPMLLGFFRPCIVLPTADISDSYFQYTVIHELTHYKRRDMFYKWLVQITVCLHWFNPFVYLMGREISRACELSCDEAVIRKLDVKSQRAYGDTLLNALGARGSYKNSIASVTLNESGELLKERLEAIMKFKRKSMLVTSTALVLTVLLCTGALATGAYAAQSIKETNNSVNTNAKNSVSLPIFNVNADEEISSTGILAVGEEDINQFYFYNMKAGQAFHITYDPEANYGIGDFEVGLFDESNNKITAQKKLCKANDTVTIKVPADGRYRFYCRGDKANLESQVQYHFILSFSNSEQAVTKNTDNKSTISTKAAKTNTSKTNTSKSNTSKSNTSKTNTSKTNTSTSAVLI